MTLEAEPNRVRDAFDLTGMLSVVLVVTEGAPRRALWLLLMLLTALLESAALTPLSPEALVPTALRLMVLVFAAVFAVAEVTADIAACAATTACVDTTFKDCQFDPRLAWLMPVAVVILSALLEIEIAAAAPEGDELEVWARP